MEFEIFTLSNGLRCVYAPGLSPVAHAALYINAGARDESEDKAGLSHFLEHAVFKGTSRRKAYHILSGIDSIGGELNAFTTKEETCLHASVPDFYLAKALDLIGDIAFNSIFPKAEIEKEREVILDEILSYQDSPAEQIVEDFEDAIFNTHPLSHSILGTEASLKNIQADDLKQFVQSNYCINNMVLCITAALPIEKVKKMAEKYLAIISSNTTATRSFQHFSYVPSCNCSRKRYKPGAYSNRRKSL